jgi:hypothetical protein
MRTSLLLSLCVILIPAVAIAQPSNKAGSIQWPADPPVGIGTELSTPSGPQNALQIHYDSTKSQTKEPIIRLSDGTGTSTSIFGILGLMHSSGPLYSNLSRGKDLILHEHRYGDLILTNWYPGADAGAIRMSTMGDTDARPVTLTHSNDLERLTILRNGNLGINMPPDSATGLAIPLDQVQIGGGQIAYPGNPNPIPGLTLFGGSRFEGMPLPPPATGLFPIDWRYISFNHYVDHLSSSSNRSYRIEPMGTSEIDFAESSGGMLHFTAIPFDTNISRDSAMHDFSGAMSMSLTGESGLSVWSDESHSGGLVYHQLFNVFRPGVVPWPLTRNTNGLFVHHTPVLITSDSSTTPSIDFTHLANVHPDLGDGDTWDLAVNGPALFKEVFVNTNDWPDYVFLPDYKLRSIDEFAAYIKLNEHLPEVAPASEMNGARSLGQTQQQLTKQVEEMALYIVQLHEQLDELKSEIETLKKGGTR